MKENDLTGGRAGNSSADQYLLQCDSREDLREIVFS
jgi:hypothetical protein